MTTFVPATTASAPPSPPIGSLVYLASYLLRLTLNAEVTPSDTPNMYSGELEVLGDPGEMDLSALVGPPGFPGVASFPIRRQNDPVVNTVQDLPTTLTNTPTDIGKYWNILLYSNGLVVGMQSWVWYGTEWRVFQIGPTGPPGPIPEVQLDVLLTEPGSESYIATGGTTLQPSWQFGVAAPQGPPGPNDPIYLMPDVDETTMPPGPYDVLAFMGDYTMSGETLWKPLSMSAFATQFYSMPESAFSAYNGISQQAPVGSFAIPPQPFPWTPIVWGHIGEGGANLTGGTPPSGIPILVGCEVLLGDPSIGTLISRGLGSPIGEVNIMPHYSSAANLTQAISPKNNYALVPANHTGAQGTVYINLWNDGVLGAYDFKPGGAQLFCLVVPMEQEPPVAPTPVAPKPVTVVQTTNNQNAGWFPTAVTAGNAVVVLAGGWCSQAGEAVTIPAPTLAGVTPANAFAVFNNGGSGCLQSPGSGWANGSWLGQPGGYWISMWVLPDCAGTNGVSVTVDDTSHVGVYAFTALEVSGLGPLPYLDAQSQGFGGPSSVPYDSGRSGVTHVDNALVLAGFASGGGVGSLPGAPWTTFNDTYGGGGYQVQSRAGSTYEWSGTASWNDSWVAAVAVLVAAPPGELPSSPRPVIAGGRNGQVRKRRQSRRGRRAT